MWELQEYTITRSYGKIHININGFVTIIKEKAFISQNIDSVIIPDSVITISSLAFYNNNLTTVNIPNSVTRIDRYAFYNNNLTEVVIPNSTIKINQSTFELNNLTKVTIPNSVISIGRRAFADNNLKEVTIPNSVTSIDSEAFYSNPSLIKVIVKGGDKELKLSTFPASFAGNDSAIKRTTDDSIYIYILRVLKHGIYIQVNLMTTRTILARQVQ